MTFVGLSTFANVAQLSLVSAIRGLGSELREILMPAPAELLGKGKRSTQHISFWLRLS
jgi:hypothetical protein